MLAESELCSPHYLVVSPQQLMESAMSNSVAMMELLIFISTLLYRYDFKLVDPEPLELEVSEGFLRKACLIFIYNSTQSADGFCLGNFSLLDVKWESNDVKSEVLELSQMYQIPGMKFKRMSVIQTYKG